MTLDFLKTAAANNNEVMINAAFVEGIKEILKKDYGIYWKSPQELNPMIKFN